MDERAVNITIATYNRLECTRRCLASVRELAGHPHRIVVVDNSSADGTREFLRAELDAGRIHRLALLDSNMGVSPAYNLGWELYPAPYFMKVDNDVQFLREGWLAALVAMADRHAEAGMLGFGCAASSLRYAPETELLLHHQGHVGGCALFRADVLARLGWWCEDYGRYGEEDSDMGLRARLAGCVNLTLCDPERPWLRYTDGLDADEAAYRGWKDGQRDANLAFRYRFNTTLYKCGLRPLYVGRRYLAEVEGLSARFRLNRQYTRELAALERKYLPHLDTLLASDELRWINEKLGLDFWY